ncbi:LppM family (lipo)protein [Actinomyces bowdenii]|uniref:LppM family (lipo)protein n=1 Tax=Actinomyces bowdenii TaxID=131109 RepID=UPI001FD36614|nr:translation initiation factor 2 [Actinomyces bowdenii]
MLRSARLTRLPRLGLRAGLVAPACLALAGCTAAMDMTISAQGTYDVVLEMRDTTGSTFGPSPDCSAYEDPTAMSIPEGTSVTTEVLTGEEGNGCLVTITGVEIPEASQAAEGTMVVRDGDLYTVTIPAFGPDASQGAAQGQDGSFNSVVRARASIAFPGAVTRADDGGRINGRTVTWEDADVLVEGVSASGYAQDARGVPWWKRAGGWLTAALVMAGAGAGVAAVRRRRAPGRRRRR